MFENQSGSIVSPSTYNHPAPSLLTTGIMTTYNSYHSNINPHCALSSRPYNPSNPYRFHDVSATATQGNNNVKPGLYQNNTVSSGSHESVAMDTYPEQDECDEDIGDEFSPDELDEVARFQNSCIMAETGLGTNATSSIDVSKQLLNFADMVNVDIQKYFGKNKNHVDYTCDNFEEDKLATKKSGRELYYADILKIAQGLDDDGDEKPVKTNTKSNTNTLGEPKTAYSGKLNLNLGLGPFEDLFKHHIRSSDNQNVDSTARNAFNASDKSVPMHCRNLPESFWKEPGKNQGSCCSKVNPEKTVSSGMISTTKAPDFSDLLESWTREVSTCVVTSTNTTTLSSQSTNVTDV